MDTKHFRLLAFLTLACPCHCRAEQLSDSQLLEISQSVFSQWKSAKDQNLAKQAIRDGMAHLSDAEKTRAMALRVFDLDAKDNGRMRYNAPSSVEIVLMTDPAIIKDTRELEAMIASETDARKFFILASMANQLMEVHKSDFVVEVAPMLFRHEPLARMSIDSEYYFENLSDASFFAYEMIVRNLKILNADFIPADEELPYPDKISILVTWLKKHYPGCEQLGEQKSTIQDINKLTASEKSLVRQNKRNSSPNEPETSRRTSSGTSWWLISLATTLLIAILAIWLKAKSPINTL